MQVRILGAHYLESKETRLTSLLIDGVLALDAGSLCSSLSLTEQYRIKAILITHEHFDYIKDLLLIGLATAQSVTSIYAPLSVLETLSTNLLDGKLYPKMTEWPVKDSPSLRLNAIKPLHQVTIENYRVKAVPVSHAIYTVGYELVSPEGNSLFFTGDTGPGLMSCWEHVSPDLLITEVSLPNSWEARARQAGHLTPRMLEDELCQFQRTKNYTPKIVIVHRDPAMDGEIIEELQGVAQRIDATIIPGSAGMKIQV